MDAIFFYIFAFLTLGGAVMTVTRRNAVHSALALIVSLLGVAGLFLMQQAEFLFAVQIILYIGGIMVLFLFVIMLVNLDAPAMQRPFNRQAWTALACALAIAGAGAAIVRKGGFTLPAPAAATAQTGNTELIATGLFNDYLVPFELTSVLLLVAIVGCVMMAKKRI